MLLIGESYVERQQSIISCITVGRQLIKTMKKARAKYPALSSEFNKSIADQVEYVKDNFDELVELEKWRLVEGLDKDERYKYFLDEQWIEVNEQG